MSSTFGRPLRALVSSTASLRPAVSHRQIRTSPSSSAHSRVLSTVQLHRRSFASLPPSTPGPPISLPPPSSPRSQGEPVSERDLHPLATESAPSPPPLDPPTGSISALDQPQDSSPLSPPASSLSQLPRASSDSDPIPSQPSRPSTQSQSPRISPRSPSAPSASSEAASFERRFNELSSQASSTIRNAATQTSQRFWKEADHLATQAVSRFSMMGAKLNEITGYDRIEGLKKVVTERETEIANLRTSLQTAKQTYLASVTARSTSQREVNDLLQRKPTWRSTDVDRFTVLVREDHDNSRLEEESKAEMDSAEGKVESAFTELMNAILNRYHEEQLWSDKLRSFSTNVSIAVMLANLLVFITAIVFVEPYKRKRLAQTFEERVTEMTGQVERRIEGGVERVLRGLMARDRLMSEAREGGREVTVEEVEMAVAGAGAVEEGKALEEMVVAADQPPPVVTEGVTEPVVPRGPYVPFLPSWVRLPSLKVNWLLLSPAVLASHLPTIDKETPRELLETSRDALDASKTFVEKGIEHEGRERDLLVVGAGGVVAGAGLAGLLYRLIR